MPKYMITATYSSGSWARMLQNSGDRTGAVKAVADGVGGYVEANRCLHCHPCARDVSHVYEMPGQSAME
jgi:hypothetical protein